MLPVVPPLPIWRLAFVEPSPESDEAVDANDRAARIGIASGEDGQSVGVVVARHLKEPRPADRAAEGDGTRVGAAGAVEDHLRAAAARAQGDVLADRQVQSEIQKSVVREPAVVQVDPGRAGNTWDWFPWPSARARRALSTVTGPVNELAVLLSMSRESCAGGP